jgi:hypothetical protein
VLEDFESGDRPDWRPLVRIARQVKDVDEALRFVAQVHEQPDRAGSWYVSHPARDLLAHRELFSGGV